MHKSEIRRQTDNFLGKLQRSPSFGLESQEMWNTKYLSDDAVSRWKKNLTAASAAILPMQIVTVGSKGERIELTLLINPDTWNHSKVNQAQAAYTRGGWQVQLWGNNQDTINSTGKTAAMMIPGVGLDNFLQESSFAYLNLMGIIGAYRSNGYTFLDRTAVQNVLTRVIGIIRGVQIYYDNHVYMGHFNSFSLEEESERPFILNYGFEFVVSSLDNNDSEIRGHYKPLPTAVESREITDRMTTDFGIGYSSTVSDIYTSPTYDLAPAIGTDDQTTLRYWEKTTGLPWSEAYNLNYTDGSVKGNMELRGIMRSMTWDPNQKRFI